MSVLKVALIASSLLVASMPAMANLQLAQKYSCTACHAVDKKIVGPAYKDVAKKYATVAGAEAKMIAKIKAGGAGVWGPIPMPPHPQISDADLKILAKWVLAQK